MLGVDRQLCDAFAFHCQAQHMKEGTILQLFADKSAVPVEAAYQLSVLVDRPEGLEDRAEFAR